MPSRSRDVSLACRCGAVLGVAHDVGPKTGNRAICYCDDCQAFAHWLDRATDILDASGGTDIFQMSQAKIDLTHGLEHVACLRLTANGLVRWYASCCNTPIGNTVATRQVPFVGLIRGFIAESALDAPLDEVLGPVRGRVHARFATGAPPGADHSGPPWRMLVRVLGMMLSWRLRGDHLRSPFFVAATGELRAVPRVLTENERGALRNRAVQTLRR
jgi:Family of unknown function (DUF6151)